MPYYDLKELPPIIKNALTKEGQQIYMNEYMKWYELGNTEDYCISRAWNKSKKFLKRGKNKSLVRRLLFWKHD